MTTTTNSSVQKSGATCSTDGVENLCHVVDFAKVIPTECPCGLARRAFMNDPRVPFSMHVTEITQNAKLHYHKGLTETYYVLECGADAMLQLNSDQIALHPGMAILIPPGVRHRAIGEMRVMIVATPKFDPQDEWFDE